MGFKEVISAIMLAGSVSAVNADVCKIEPGSVSCGTGVVNRLSGNGMVSVNGTTIIGPTIVNGMLNANEATFATLQVHGSVSLLQCAIRDSADIMGSLRASASTFDQSLNVYSSIIRLVKSKIAKSLHIHHTINDKQVVYLDEKSEIGGDIIFDDGDGAVIVRGDSKILGRVIGGQVIIK